MSKKTKVGTQKMSTEPAAEKKVAMPRAAVQPLKQYGSLQWREGGSAQIAAEILTSKKEITQADALAQFEKQVTDSSNSAARVRLIAGMLVKAGVIERTKGDKGEIGYKLKGGRHGK